MWIKLLAACIRYHILLLSGHVRLSIPVAHDTTQPDEGSNNITTSARPFLKVERSIPRPSAIARLEVTFHVSQISVFNRFIIPFASIPFFAGAPGFISKTFYCNAENHAYSGLYEWADRDSIGDYLGSYAMKFMSLISEPQALHWHITPVSELAEIDGSLPVSQQE